VVCFQARVEYDLSSEDIWDRFESNGNPLYLEIAIKSVCMYLYGFCTSEYSP